MQPSSRPTRRLLDALRVLSLVPLLVTGLVVGTDYHTTIDAAEAQADKSITILHEHALKVFEIYDLVLDQVAAYDGDLIGLPVQSHAMSRFLEWLKTPREEIASIWVVGPDGTPLAASTAWQPGTTAQG